jgi:signal peptidase II
VTEPSGPAGRPHWAVFVGLAAVVVVLDQATKVWLAATIDPGETIEVLGDWLRFVHGRNTGALFGLFRDSAVLFAVVSLGVIGIIAWFHARSTPSRATSIALGLLLGGAIGNLIDRLRFGYVLDWIDMGIGDRRFYTYNVADAAITVAIVSLIVLAIFPGVGRAIDGIGRAERPADA